jgi:hypothetical protein
MHGSAILTPSTAFSLAVFYLLVVILNLAYAAYQFYVNRDRKQAAIWAGVAGIFLIHSLLYFMPARPVLPEGFRHLTTRIMGAYHGQAGPILYTVVSVIAFAALVYWRKTLTKPTIAWTILNVTLLVGGWSMTDKSFRQIVGKADNIPITMLIFSVGFFTWLALSKAVQNDERMAKGEPPLEKLEDEKVLVWPDLVYTELICTVICTFVLVVWAVVLKAPLEEPATSAKAPNPSKAPWYFLGLQEMLVYYDPWMAGVVLPSMIIVGLIAIPYIDFNQKGNGYFTFVQRRFSVMTFMIGFVVMWVTLIVLGTFLRGPNWNFFGPFEPWDPHKVLPLNNINLSEIFWLHWLGRPVEGMSPLLRELPGVIVVLAYLFLLPQLLAKTVLRSFFIKMGFVRFMLLVNLIQFMAALPIKMILRWAINLKYVVAFPESFFNI